MEKIRFEGKKIHMAGIGGIGMSGVAQWLKALGADVSGTDLQESEPVMKLRASGIEVTVTAEPLLPPETELLVYSDAIRPEHPLRAAAKEKGLPAVSYAEALGALTEGLKLAAVSGSHGKSTCSSLIASLLLSVKADPTVLVGTLMPELGGSNFRFGAGSLAVVEADEYREHFLHLSPAVSVVLNIDHDHVDYFNTPAAYRDAFGKFAERTLGGGLIVMHAPVRALLEKELAGRRFVTFGIAPEESADITAQNIESGARGTAFTLAVRGKEIGRVESPFFGRHNVLNVLAALAVMDEFGFGFAETIGSVPRFRGIWRRFENIGEIYGATAVSDYAHHPREVAALIEAAKQRFPRRAVIVFEPHQISRTEYFGEEFCEALARADEAIVVETYRVPGREEKGSRPLSFWADRINAMGGKAHYAKDPAEALSLLKKIMNGAEAVVFAGAGSMDAAVREALRK